MQTNKGYGIPGLIAVLGLIALLAGFIVMLVLPGILYAAWATLALGILLLAIAFILDFRQVGRALTGRRGKFSTGTTVMTSIFIGIVLLVNAISVGSYYRFDATGVAQFTLAQQTKDVLKNLKTPVKALAFFVPSISPTNDPGNTAAILYGYGSNMLTEYKFYSDKLSVEYIDPDEHPDQARQYGITQYQTIVFVTENNPGHPKLVPLAQFVTTDSQGNPTGIDAEHALTSAILEVTGTIQKKIYFLSGHGESSIDADYTNLGKSLQDNLYQVATLDLTISPGIPADSAVLVIAGPQEVIPPNELAIIKQYLDSGRQALVMLNPNSPKGVKQFLANWGITVGDGTVIDPSSYVSPNIDFPSVPSDRNTFGLATIYFPGATTIIPDSQYEPTVTLTDQGDLGSVLWKSKDSPIQMDRLVWTSNDSWLETNFSPIQAPGFDNKTEVKGPLALSFRIFIPPGDVTSTEQGTALIVIGDSDFVSNQHYFNGNNSDFFLNAVNSLTAGKELIKIERKVLPFRRLLILPEQANFIRISSIAVLPLLVLIAGGIIWWRRR